MWGKNMACLCDSILLYAPLEAWWESTVREQWMGLLSKRKCMELFQTKEEFDPLEVASFLKYGNISWHLKGMAMLQVMEYFLHLFHRDSLKWAQWSANTQLDQLRFISGCRWVSPLTSIYMAPSLMHIRRYSITPPTTAQSCQKVYLPRRSGNLETLRG